MTQLTQDSVETYKALGVYTESGGIEVARTTERLEELKRRLVSAKSWGEPAELLTPAQVKEMVPSSTRMSFLAAFGLRRPALSIHCEQERSCVKGPRSWTLSRPMPMSK